jgi:arylsulfatase A-like enzyme
VDHHLGRILGALDRAGKANDTIVVFTADHGDFGGWGGMVSKGGAFQDCLTRVPLIVADPVIGGAVEDGFASLCDVLPFLLDRTACPVRVAMDGRADVMRRAPRKQVVSEYGAGGPLLRWSACSTRDLPTGIEGIKATLAEREAEGMRAMIRWSNWKYIDDPMGDIPELYDLTRDPDERANLALTGGHAAQVQSGAAALRAWRRRAPLSGI